MTLRQIWLAMGLGLLGALFLAACGGQRPPVTPTATSTPVEALPWATASPMPTATATATVTPSPTPTPFSFDRGIARLQEALRRHDVQALTLLMSDTVTTGYYGTNYTWQAPASQIAATLAEGAPTTPPPCWAFDRLPRGVEVVLGGFRFTGGRPYLWRLASGDVEAVLFIYEPQPPYRITTVMPLTAEERPFFQGLTCESVAVQAVAYPTPLPTPTPEPRLCPNSPPPHLTVGEFAYVAFSPPLPNRIRSIPAKQGEVIERVQPGESMKVLDGPVCRDGWTWWKVRVLRSGIVGWTAEGDGDVYWLKPCHTLPECP